MNQTRRTIGGLALPALLLTLLLLLVAQAESQPLTETENESDIASLPPDVDNVELHHVKLVDGVMTEDHPVVMYKEDFVSEDYDPAKNQTKASHHRQYKHLKRTRHHHSRTAVEKQQEKILFDVLPETPIFVDDAADDDSGADNFEAAPLLVPSKQDSLQKYPKKYHSRQRRQAPYHYKNDYYVHQQQLQYRNYPGQYYLPVEPPRQYQRYPVEGKKPKYQGKLPNWRTKPNQPIDIGTRLGEENSLFHDSNPANADFSKFNQPRPEARPPSSSSNSNNWQSSPLPTRAPSFNFQSPPEVEEPRPIWDRPASLPVFSSPPRGEPTYRQDVLVYPEEPTYEVGSACHRASRLCCNLSNLASLYDCFLHQNCENSISEILSTCS